MSATTGAKGGRKSRGCEGWPVSVFVLLDHLECLQLDGRRSRCVSRFG